MWWNYKFAWNLCNLDLAYLNREPTFKTTFTQSNHHFEVEDLRLVFSANKFRNFSALNLLNMKCSQVSIYFVRTSIAPITDFTIKWFFSSMSFHMSLQITTWRRKETTERARELPIWSSYGFLTIAITWRRNNLNFKSILLITI